MHYRLLGYKSHFSDYRPLEVSLGVTLGDGHHLKTVGHGPGTRVCHPSAGNAVR